MCFYIIILVLCKDRRVTLVEERQISQAVIRRLPRYYRYLGDLLEHGVELDELYASLYTKNKEDKNMLTFRA